MPITSFTGKPGNGKTCLMIEHLQQQAKKAERPLWASGIDGLTPGLATVFKDPRDWNAVLPGATCHCDDTDNPDPCEAHVIPNGSLIYIDEAWKWFGHLHDASRQATPKHVLGLAEHRHRGIDFVWTYQQPSQIYPFARGLMADHYHVVRRFGTKMIDVFKWEELCEDVKSPAKREAAQRTTRALPKLSFAAFKSAEIHTIKPSVPWKVMAIPGLAVAAVLAGWFAYTQLKPDAFAASLTGKGPAAAAGGAAPALAGSAAKPADAPRYANAFEYAKVHLPRIGVMPWTAEIFDAREFTADPELFCMASMPGAGGDGKQISEPTCTCLTEQGTAYDLSQPECRTIARRGPVYNPYRARGKESGLARQELQEGRSAPTDFNGTVIAGEATAVGSRGLVPSPGTAKPPLVSPPTDSTSSSSSSSPSSSGI